MFVVSCACVVNQIEKIQISRGRGDAGTIEWWKNRLQNNLFWLQCCLTIVKQFVELQCKLLCMAPAQTLNSRKGLHTSETQINFIFMPLAF